MCRVDEPGRGVVNTSSKRGVSQGHHHSTLNHNPSPQSVTEALVQPKLTATRWTCRPKKHELNPTSAPKTATRKPKKKAGESVKTAASKPTTPNLVLYTQSSTSTLNEISVLLHYLSLQACVELIRRLLTSISSLPKGAPVRELS
jgi:hypothetical protein